MECHHQGFVAVAHIDKWDHATRTPSSSENLVPWREWENPPKKAATKEQVEYLPWSQKIQGGSCSQVSRILGTKDLRDTASVNWDDMTYTVCLGLATWKGGYGLGRCQSQYTRQKSTCAELRCPNAVNMKVMTWRAGRYFRHIEKW